MHICVQRALELPASYKSVALTTEFNPREPKSANRDGSRCQRSTCWRDLIAPVPGTVQSAARAPVNGFTSSTWTEGVTADSSSSAGSYLTPICHSDKICAEESRVTHSHAGTRWTFLPAHWHIISEKRTRLKITGIAVVIIGGSFAYIKKPLSSHMHVSFPTKERSLTYCVLALIFTGKLSYKQQQHDKSQVRGYTQVQNILPVDDATGDEPTQADRVTVRMQRTFSIPETRLLQVASSDSPTGIRKLPS